MDKDFYKNLYVFIHKSMKCKEIMLLVEYLEIIILLINMEERN